MDLQPAPSLLRMQEAAKRRENSRVRRSSVWGLSLGTAFEDAQEAATGIIGDLYGTSKRASFTEIMGEGDRIRGLGVLCLVCAFAGCLVNGLLSD